MRLEVCDYKLGICRLSSQEALHEWMLKGTFFSVSRTPEELSVVCDETLIPDGIRCEKNWRCLKVKGHLDFSVVGVVSALSKVLAEHSISIFVISTFDTDYLLVKTENFQKAILVLNQAGFPTDASSG
jgi:hypothetical protein